jgi:signal peptidase I
MRRRLLAVGIIVVIAVVIALGVYGSDISVFLFPSQGQNKLLVAGSSMEPTIKQGATIFYDKTNYTSLKVNDIIVFTHTAQLHVARITGITADGLMTKGDNNPAPFPWNVTETDYMGKVTQINNP